MFYGWVIVAGVLLAQLFMVGVWTYGFPRLVGPVQAEFGASLRDVQLGLTVGAIAGSAAAPLLGPVVDRWSARGLSIIGSLMLVAALWLMSVCQGVYQFAAIVAVVLNAGNLLLGPITGSTLVSRWFARTRGRALGIAATGTSIGGVLVPLLLGGWIQSLGWRGALQRLALCVAIVVVPMMVFGLRDDPRDKGLHPDGDEADPEISGPPLASRSWTTLEVLRCPAYWLVALSMGLLFLAYVGVLANLHVYGTSLGIAPDQATRLITTIAICGFVGKLVFGWAADLIPLRVGLWCAHLLAGIGIAILSLEPGYAGMLLGCVSMGLAAGGMLPVWSAMIAAAFGVASFGRVMGLMMPVIGIVSGPGPLLGAESMDRTASFGPAMQGFVLAVVVAAMLLIPLRLDAPAPEPAAEAA